MRSRFWLEQEPSKSRRLGAIVGLTDWVIRYQYRPEVVHDIDSTFQWRGVRA